MIMSVDRARARLRALALLVLVACVGCDQASKRIATDCLGAGPAVLLSGGMIRLDRVENTGGFLSLGSGLPPGARFWIYVGVVGAGLTLLAGYLLVRPPIVRGNAVAMALVLGGGLGNWLDRVAHDGTVVDFVQLRLGPLHTGIFNLADTAILAGGLLLLHVRARERVRG